MQKIDWKQTADGQMDKRRRFRVDKVTEWKPNLNQETTVKLTSDLSATRFAAMDSDSSTTNNLFLAPNFCRIAETWSSLVSFCRSDLNLDVKHDNQVF